MLQRLGIRGKLLAVVATPTIVLLLAASFVVFNAASAYTAGRETTELVELVEMGTPLVTSLQVERARVSDYLRALSDGEGDRVTARNAVNTAVATLRNTGAADPSFAPVADRIVAAVEGTNGTQSLEESRKIVIVEPVSEGFPVWPQDSAIQTQIDEFNRIADEVALAAQDAPINDTGNIARSLSALIKVEATATESYLTDARTAAEALPGDYDVTDRSMAVFAKQAGGVPDTGNNQGVTDFLAEATKGMEALTAVRERTRDFTVQANAAENSYTSVISDLLSATREIANITDDRTLSNDLKGYVSMAELVEAMRLEEVYVKRKIAQGFWRLGETVQFQAYYFGTNNAHTNAVNAVAPLSGIPAVPKFGISFNAATVNGFVQIRDRVFNDTTSGLISQRNNDWPAQVDAELVVYEPIIAELESAVDARAASVERNSLIQTLATIAVAALAVGASLFVALSISRRIVNPLRRLTTTATAVRQELPRLVERVAMPGQTVDVSEVQIPVESQDEVGRLAEAFNSINAATLSIAAEQAALRGSISEMFVNVARRDQVLLNRQLASIDEMERTEDNQDTLTKLFALDHLATRMRRNSESLLVLAGIDTGRRLRRPMPLSDVIRTASSEIELYERVQLELDADPAMLGHSALTAAHLFAELLENATVFSDPGTQVTVRTMERDGTFVVSVLDHGIGMTPEELAEANSRVASTAASEILGAQRLGLFVVGRIARRVGARVHLDSAEGRGTEATVVMPPSLFDPSAGFRPTHPNVSTTDDRIHAPSALVHHEPVIEEAPEPTPAKQRLAAYQPTVIEEGASLSGRAGDGPEQPSAAVTSRGIPVLESDGARDLDNLVAADAADAPVAIPFDLEEMTAGVTDVGLPTRRRRANSGPEAPHETNSIIALPQRASDEQLSALRSAATSGFTPILAADEVSPESAEARSRVFRGFRPLRGTDTEPVELAPDAESLGHAMRRGVASGDDQPEAAGVPAISGAVPVAPVAFEPEHGAGDRAHDVMKNFAIDAADPRDRQAPIVRQSPLITTGYIDENAPGSGILHTGEIPSSGMLVPQLEDDDDEPVEVAPPTRGRTPVDDRWQSAHEGEEAGVESVSLDDVPGPAPQAEAAPYRSPLYPAATNPWQQQVPADTHQTPVVQQQAPAHQQPQVPQRESLTPQRAPMAPHFESDPVTSVPSLDELIMDGAGAQQGDERAGFFSKFFGKPTRPETPQDFGTGSMPVLTPTGPQTGSMPSMAAPAWAIPARDVEPRPEPVMPQSFGAPVAYEQPHQAPWGANPASGPIAEYGGESALVEEEGPSQWTMLPPATHQAQLPFPEPSVSRYGTPDFDAKQPAPTTNPGFAVLPSLDNARARGPLSGPPPAFVPYDAGTVYSPDQLARPLGWETAGASALQAAAPEAATEYRPVVQITPDWSDSGPEDFASAVFSELSSLAAERPKVEKTSAGLQKRTPVAREEPREEPVAAAAAAPRDADAVRSRFSAFYSGTQRARDDVQNFHESTQGSLTES